MHALKSVLHGEKKMQHSRAPASPTLLQLPGKLSSSGYSLTQRCLGEIRGAQATLGMQVENDAESRPKGKKNNPVCFNLMRNHSHLSISDLYLSISILMVITVAVY